MQTRAAKIVRKGAVFRGRRVPQCKNISIEKCRQNQMDRDGAVVFLLHFSSMCSRDQKLTPQTK